MKNSILLIILLLWNVSSINAQIIMGRCIDKGKNPMIGTNIYITDSDTLHIVYATITDSNGQFKIEGTLIGEYLIHMSTIGFKKKVLELNINGDTDLGDVILEEDVQLLDEIVITSNLLKTYGNKDELLISEKLKLQSSNALDAIEMMPQFRKNLSTDELETFDRKKILILINGIRSDSKELFLLQANDVKKIIYYSNPPTKYAFENYESVIDVRTKVKKDKSYSVSLDTKNALTTGYGTNILGVNYSDSLSKIDASYFIDYRNLRNNKMYNIYDYGDAKNAYKGLPGKYKGEYHRGQVAYQRFLKNNIFNAKLVYRRNPGNERYGQQVLTKQHNKTYGGYSSKDLRSDYESLALDLYYMKSYSENRNLSFNIVNTLYSSESDNTLERMMNDNHALDYKYNNLFKNKSYSCIAEVYYNTLLWNGYWNIGGYFSFKEMEQTFNTVNHYSINNKRGYVYTDYSNNFGKLSYTLGVGFDYILYNGIDENNSEFRLVRPSISLNYQLSKHLSFRLNSLIQPEVPNMGDLTNSVVNLDENFYSKGNIALKPYYTFYNGLQIQYSSKSNFIFSPLFSYKYDSHPNSLVFFKENENVFLQQIALDRSQTLNAGFYMSYTPKSWLTIAPYYNYYYSFYNTLNNKIRHSFHNVGIELRMMYKKIQLRWFGCLPFTTVSGDVYYKTGGNMSASALWKHKSITFGLEWIYNPYPNQSFGKYGKFSFSEEKVWGNFNDLICVKFAYHLSKGKARSHKEKVLNNSDMDSGLTNINTAK